MNLHALGVAWDYRGAGVISGIRRVAHVLLGYLVRHQSFTSINKVPTPILEDQKLKDLKAKIYLFQAIDRSILETVLKDTAKDIWDSPK